MFCPKCKGLMYPKGDVLVCGRCGFKKKKDESEDVVVDEQKKRDVAVIEEKDDVRPRTKDVSCPKCGHNEAYWELRQMRAADEPESRFYTCTKCGYRWRKD